MSANFKTIDAELIPPGAIGSVEEFKQLVIDDVYHLMKLKKEFQEETQSEVPLPISMYVLFDDFSFQRVKLMPRSAIEKRVLFMAIKKQIADRAFPNTHSTSTNPIYGAFSAEVFMGSYQMTEEDKELSEEDLEEKYRAYFAANENKFSRVTVQFEDVATKLVNVEVFSILDPCILVKEDDESEKFTESLNNAEPNTEFYMRSLFDYTKAQEIDVLGSQAKFNIMQMNLIEAIETIRKTLVP